MFARLTLSFALVALALAVARAEDKKKEDAKPEVDKPAPAIDLPATSIKTVLPDAKDKTTLSLKDFEGKKNVVLFFYPKALTSGCTAESCGFRDKLKDFEKADTVVIGISTDTLEKQEEFTKKNDLNFPLFADTEKKAAKAYDSLGNKGFASRNTFVIDKKGVIRKVYRPGGGNAKHPAEVLKWVEENLAK